MIRSYRKTSAPVPTTAGTQPEDRRLVMREKFEFASKVIGLILVCLGLFLASYLAHLVFFGGSEYRELLKIYREGGLIAEKPVLEAMFSTFQIEQKFHIKLLLVCLLQIPVGMYLMRPDNFFVRWAVPHAGTPAARKAQLIRLENPASKTPDVPDYPLTKKIPPRH